VEIVGAFRCTGPAQLNRRIVYLVRVAVRPCDRSADCRQEGGRCGRPPEDGGALHRFRPLLITSLTLLPRGRRVPARGL
jgi:hypothetical protein